MQRAPCLKRPPPLRTRHLLRPGHPHPSPCTAAPFFLASLFIFAGTAGSAARTRPGRRWWSRARCGSGGGRCTRAWLSRASAARAPPSRRRSLAGGCVPWAEGAEALGGQRLAAVLTVETGAGEAGNTKRGSLCEGELQNRVADVDAGRGVKWEGAVSHERGWEKRNLGLAHRLSRLSRICWCHHLTTPLIVALAGLEIAWPMMPPCVLQSSKDMSQKWFVVDPAAVLIAVPDRSAPLNHGRILSVAPALHTVAQVGRWCLRRRRRGGHCRSLCHLCRRLCLRLCLRCARRRRRRRRHRHRRTRCAAQSNATNTPYFSLFELASDPSSHALLGG